MGFALKKLNAYLLYVPWKSKDHRFTGLFEKTIILVGIYN